MDKDKPKSCPNNHTSTSSNSSPATSSSLAAEEINCILSTGGSSTSFTQFTSATQNLQLPGANNRNNWQITPVSTDPPEIAVTENYAGDVPWGQLPQNFVAHRFVLENFEEIYVQEEFLSLPLEMLLILITSNRLNVRKEETVYEAILHWISYDVEARKPYFSRLIKHIRLGLLDPEYIIKRVKTTKYLDEELKALIIEALKYCFDLGSTSTDFFPLTLPRIPAEVLFTTGGWSGDHLTDLVEIYKPATNKWIMIDEVLAGGERATHGCAVFGKRIIIIGGYVGMAATNDCQQFNATSRQWSTIAPMNILRSGVCVTIFKEFIYAFGGKDGNIIHSSYECYDTITNQWNLQGDMAEQRCRSAAAASPDGSVYLIGGFNGVESLKTCEKLEVATSVWSNIQSMTHRREGLGCVYFKGCVYAFGGTDGFLTHRSAEVYCCATNQWSFLPPMLRPRENFAIQLFHENVFLIGGDTGFETTANVDIYNIQQSLWTTCMNLSSPRSFCCAGTLKTSDCRQEDVENLLLLYEDGI